MDYLIVAESQHKVLGKGVGDSECDQILVEFAVNGIQGKVIECVMHPTHIPLEIKPQTTNVIWISHQGPGGAFLGNRDTSRVLGVDRTIEFFEEGNRFQVFPPTKFICEPVAFSRSKSK